MSPPSFPRRQQRRRLRRAAASTAAALAAGAFAGIAVALDTPLLANAFLLIMVGLVIDARRWSRLANRSRVGAHSEDAVRRALTPLAAEGWRLQHSLSRRGHGDIDSIAIAPTGIAFAIETKTKRFEHHLAAVREMAVWLHRRRRASVGLLLTLYLFSRGSGSPRVPAVVAVVVLAVAGLCPGRLPWGESDRMIQAFTRSR